MTEILSSVVGFRGDRLFNGAVNMDWFENDPGRRDLASSTFVFHGPDYHGVSQKDVGVTHGHNLIDTANFARSIVRQSHGLDDQTFTLAIAGYGTGKSHLGLTLASLLSQPDSETASHIMESIESVDKEIGAEVRNLLTTTKPCIVIALNGMQNFDLTAEITRQIHKQIKHLNLDTRALDELRPRFSQAINLINMATANQDLIAELVDSCNLETIEEIVTQLAAQDDDVYRNVHKVLADKNIQIAALGGESIRDVIDVTTREYCGEDKPFQSLVVLFDEFGRYTEFATIRSHIAGSGVLQDLFEGVQNNSNTTCFIGFIQFELNAYVQRVAPEYRNEILRYITRYQAANRNYLSINLETLIASLFKKKKPQLLDQWFENDGAKQCSIQISDNINRWFPQSRNHRLWNDDTQFHKVIRKGCWPLSAYSTWFLYHLAAAGKHLQERSALALLDDAYARFQTMPLTDEPKWSMAPVDLWSESLQHELLTSEEGGQQGALAHAFASVISRHGVQFEESQLRLLKAIVLASKMGLKAADKNDATEALSAVAGIEIPITSEIIRMLQEEFNVIEWDENFKEFDILGDAVPRTQFLAFLRQEVANSYDATAKASLFASEAVKKWTTHFEDIDCDFADENKITTKEWRFQGVTSNLEYFQMVVKLQADRWKEAISVDEPRGAVIYCYVDPDQDLKIIKKDASKLLRAAAYQNDLKVLPILVVLVHDEEGKLGQYLAELAVLDGSISNENKRKFGNLIPAHVDKTLSVMNELIGSMIKARHYITGFEEPITANRLSKVATEVFTRIYQNPIVFPFDGFSTARGNAANTCRELTSDLLAGKLDWDAVQGKPVQVRNRAESVLHNAWGIFAKESGKIRSRPINPILRTLTEDWDKSLSSGSKKISLEKAFYDLCAPPFGANLASAGLFLGVFFSPRLDRLSIMRNGQNCAISQWMMGGVFRGKFIDISRLHEVDLLLTGEEASQWESLINEWDQADSHLLRASYLDQAALLETRIPIPPGLKYRVELRKTQGETSKRELGKMVRHKKDALTTIEDGIRNEDVISLAKGAASLVKLLDKMDDEEPLWDKQDTEKLQPEHEEARQYIIQFFPEWIQKQYPKTNSPDKVGGFKHFMLHDVCEWLEELELYELAEEVVDHTKRVVSKVEIIAKANQLIHEVQTWLTSHGDATEFVRVSELRSLSHVGKQFLENLEEFSKRVKMGTLVEIRAQLKLRLEKYKELEKAVMERAGKLWNTTLDSEKDLELLQSEVDALMGVFENCSIDLEDLQLMRQLLRLYSQNFQMLSDDRLNWAEFEKFAKDAISDDEKYLGENEVPWSPAEVIGNFTKIISNHRVEISRQWIDEIISEVKQVDSMAAIDANQLLSRAGTPPPLLTESDSKKLVSLIKKIESRLDVLKLDWLVEKYRELPKQTQEEFLKIIIE